MGIPNPNTSERSSTFVRDRRAVIIDSHGVAQETFLWRVSNQLGVLLPVVNLVDKPSDSDKPEEHIGWNLTLSGLFR
jgi:hypothetical protein